MHTKGQADCYKVGDKVFINDSDAVNLYSQHLDALMRLQGANNGVLTVRKVKGPWVYVEGYEQHLHASFVTPSFPPPSISRGFGPSFGLRQAQVKAQGDVPQAKASEPQSGDCSGNLHTQGKTLGSKPGNLEALTAGELDPNGIDQHSPGAKLDCGKILAHTVMGGFANALKAVCEVGSFGARKYTEDGWRAVPNAQKRYTDAMLRHYLAEAAGEPRDVESKLLHAAHLAWNALARLEKILEDNTTH